MSAHKHTPGPWNVGQPYGCSIYDNNGKRVASSFEVWTSPLRPLTECKANARLIAAAPELLEALIRAQDFIDTIRQELHQRRVADWYPEGAHNAAEQMSEDMRLLGNSCADFDVSAAIAKAAGGAA